MAVRRRTQLAVPRLERPRGCVVGPRGLGAAPTAALPRAATLLRQLTTSRPLAPATEWRRPRPGAKDSASGECLGSYCRCSCGVGGASVVAAVLAQRWGGGAGAASGQRSGISWDSGVVTVDGNTMAAAGTGPESSSRTYHVVAFSGSLRKASCNAGLLRAIVEQVDGMSDLPLKVSVRRCFEPVMLVKCVQFSCL